MTAIITGDIINSRKNNTQEIWLEQLKTVLQHLNSIKTSWEIFRGDSFQIELQDYKNSFLAAMHIKATIKTIKGLDVRMAIGIGGVNYKANTVGESSGEAYFYSGQTFERLKKDKQNLKIKTNNNILNKELNLYFRLALIAMDRWTINTAETVKLTIENPNYSQTELGKILGINQNAVSGRQKRAHLNELLDLNALFQQKIETL